MMVAVKNFYFVRKSYALNVSDSHRYSRNRGRGGRVENLRGRMAAGSGWSSAHTELTIAFFASFGDARGASGAVQEFIAAGNDVNARCDVSHVVLDDAAAGRLRNALLEPVIFAYTTSRLDNFDRNRAAVGRTALAALDLRAVDFLSFFLSFDRELLPLQGSAVLHFAAVCGCVDACRILIAGGAVTELRNVAGATPRSLAAECGRVEFGADWW